VKHYVFVGSAGAYNANSIEPCHYEGDARKASAGHVEGENYLKVSRWGLVVRLWLVKPRPLVGEIKTSVTICPSVCWHAGQLIIGIN
jgi:hypothetical protein